MRRRAVGRQRTIAGLDQVPATGTVDSDQGDLVSGAAQRLGHGNGRYAGNLMLGGASAEK